MHHASDPSRLHIERVGERIMIPISEGHSGRLTQARQVSAQRLVVVRQLFVAELSSVGRRHVEPWEGHAQPLATTDPRCHTAFGCGPLLLTSNRWRLLLTRMASSQVILVSCIATTPTLLASRPS